MKILHLSAYDRGGAGTAAFRFHKGLLTRGIDSKMLVLSKRAQDVNVIAVAKALKGPTAVSTEKRSSKNHSGKEIGGSASRGKISVPNVRWAHGGHHFLRRR